MKMNHPQAPKKQTQNKPNFFKGQNRLPENPATPLSTGVAGKLLQSQ